MNRYAYLQDLMTKDGIVIVDKHGLGKDWEKVLVVVLLDMPHNLSVWQVGGCAHCMSPSYHECLSSLYILTGVLSTLGNLPSASGPHWVVLHHDTHSTLSGPGSWRFNPHG